MRGPEDSVALDEGEHQALDHLDSIRPGAAWTASQADNDEFGPVLEAALREAGEDPSAIGESIEITRALFMRTIAQLADRLLLAACALAETAERGDLAIEALERVRATLNESPSFAPAIAAAVEATGVVLGLDREGLAWAILVGLGERTTATAPESVRACSLAIDDRFSAAWPATSSGVEPAADRAPEAPRSLRVFRSAAMAAAGPSVRARFLAADHPEHLTLARALVDHHADPDTLVEQFDAARAVLDASAQPPSEPEAQTDGPKRKFTWVHLVLALIVLGLTVWHYGLR